MEALFGSENLFGSWLLPAGAGLIALGTTILGLALRVLWKRPGRGASVRESAPRIDLLDTPNALLRAEDPGVEKSAPVDRLLSELDRRIDRLERELEAFESLSAPASRLGPDPDRPSVRFVSEAQAEESPESRALRALAARGS